MKKTALSVLLVMIFAAFFACAASAEEAVSADAAGEFDFIAFAIQRVLPDFHPTVKLEDAQADFDEKPRDMGDGVTRARVGIYYKGWIRQHSMLVEIDYRAEDRKVRVNVLKDTNGTNLVGSRFFKDGEWVSIAAMGWK